MLSAISPSNSGERTSNSSAALTRERTDGELGDEWNFGEASLQNTTLHVKIHVHISYGRCSMPFSSCLYDLQRYRLLAPRTSTLNITHPGWPGCPSSTMPCPKGMQRQQCASQGGAHRNRLVSTWQDASLETMPCFVVFLLRLCSNFSLNALKKAIPSVSKIQTGRLTCEG